MTESETDEGATDDSLSLDEVRAALHALPSVEHKKLDMIARSFSGGTGLDPGEIVTDAVESSLTARSCPRELPIMVFLVQTMRSRINNHRKKCKKSVVQIYAPAGDADDNRRPDVVDVSPNAETALIEREEREKEAPDMVVIQTITGALEDDYEAQLCLAGWAEGMRGQALRDFIGVDQKNLDYIAKRIRRLAIRLYPEGWRP